MRHRARRHAQYEYALTTGQCLQTRVELLIHLDAQRRTDVLAGLYELRHHAHDGIHWHSETDASGRTRRAVDGGVDADQPPGRIEQRAAGVAGVDSGVGLDQVIDGRPAPFAVEGAVERRDDAGGERPVQSEGIADSEHFLPDLEVGTGAHRYSGRALEADADLEHGDVVLGAGAHQRSLIIATVGQFDRGRRCPLDDVEVGHHVAGIVPDEAGAGAARHGKDIARPDVTHQLSRGDVNHRPARFLEQLDGGLLVCRQITTRCHRSLGRFARTEPGFDGRQELPQQHECGDAASDDEPAPDESVRRRAAVEVGVGHAILLVEISARHRWRANAVGVAPRGCPAEMGWNKAVAVPSNQPIPASVGCALSSPDACATRRVPGCPIRAAARRDSPARSWRAPKPIPVGRRSIRRRAGRRRIRAPATNPVAPAARAAAKRPATAAPATG